MPLPKLRGGSGHQTLRRAKGVRKISSKDMAKRDNLANKISLRVKNSRQAGLKAHFKAILKKLQGPTRKHLTFVVVPECDVLLTLHVVEAGQPF
jgi:hypothetical protein